MQAQLVVAAASDLSALAPELKAEFCHNDRQCLDSLRLVNSSSSLLAEQIQHDAPYDVFLSANATYVDQLASTGKLLPGSVRTYAVGKLGILWRDGQRHPIRELTIQSVRFVALANPKLAPYGVAAQEALEYAGLWGMVQPKVVYGENVRQALQLFDSGNADAVITSDSLLKDRKADTIPDDWHAPIIQKGGVVAASRHAEDAQRFLEFTVGSAGQAIFAKYGFSPPPKP